MSTITKPRPVVKVGRTVAIVDKVGAFFLMQLHQQSAKVNRTDYYICRAVHSDLGGNGYRLEKQGIDSEEPAEVYHVHLGHSPTDHQCECKGWTYHAKPCKHLAAMLALRNAGQLPSHTSLAAFASMDAGLSIPVVVDDPLPLTPRPRSTGDMASNNPSEYADHLKSLEEAGF